MSSHSVARMQVDHLQILLELEVSDNVRFRLKVDYADPAVHKLEIVGDKK